jgi:hypothetical protein
MTHRRAALLGAAAAIVAGCGAVVVSVGGVVVVGVVVVGAGRPPLAPPHPRLHLRTL